MFFREKEAGFYVVDIDDSDEDELPHVTVKELLELKDDYIKVYIFMIEIIIKLIL